MVVDPVGPENSNLRWQYGHLWNFRVLWFTFQLSKKRQGQEQEHFNGRLMISYL
jgi:hypothetical protein